MSKHPESSAQDHSGDAEEIPLPELEFDQTIAPRPEEEVADALRSTPDPDAHSAE